MAINPKFNFTVTEDQDKIYEAAAGILGCNKTDVVRIGSYRFAMLVLEGKLDFLMEQDIKNLVE